jgi:hypothetical protein
MKMGFTGTKRGMTDKQKLVVRHLLLFNGVKEFHHGSCIGADQQAGDIATLLNIRIIIHPPLDHKYMANCSGQEIRLEKSYLVRDKDIVDESDCLIATPKEFVEELRSGTWSTVRYARKQKKPIFIVWPDGNILKENQECQNLIWNV